MENENNSSVKFWIGSTYIVFPHINLAKDFVTSLQEANEDSSTEYSNNITDFMFSVEVEYQAFHDLDEDNYEIVH